MPLFDAIDLFLDETERHGPEQMALDEALLEHAERPLLRSYRWAGQAVSFGYAQSLAAVRQSFPSWPAVRRWTGGGIVEHGYDWTFALIVPSIEPLSAARPEDTYRSIHARVAAALNELGFPARLSDSEQGAGVMACFSSPAKHDVMGLDRLKLCGGAQRRTRRGFLHQGSIQNLCLPPDFAVRLLEHLAIKTLRFSPNRATWTRTQELVSEKYGTVAWLAKVS